MGAFQLPSAIWVAILATLLSVQESHIQCLGCTRVVVAHGGARRVYARCQDLAAQGATIAYTYTKATRRLDVAFGGAAASANGWVGWGINPTSWGMVGSSVLVAFQAHNGSNVLPYKLTPAAQGGDRLLCSPVDLSIISREVEIKGTLITIFASLQLHPSQSTSLNMIWNRGSSVSSFSPLPHSLLPQDLRGFTTIDVAV